MVKPKILIKKDGSCCFNLCRENGDHEIGIPTVTIWALLCIKRRYLSLSLYKMDARALIDGIPHGDSI